MAGFSHGFPGFRFEHRGGKGYHLVAVPPGGISLSFGPGPGAKNDNGVRSAGLAVAIGLPSRIEHCSTRADRI
jgi:hypothetical protein